MTTEPTVEVIQSNDNRILKLIRSLHQRKSRHAERAFVVEGVRAIEDALLAGGNARVVLKREGSSWSLPAVARPPDVLVVSSTLFERLADTISPQPLIAVFEMPASVLPDLASPLLLLVDGVRDPGNLGTLLRSAAGAGASAVIITAGSVDPYNTKVVRAAMGAHFRIPIVEYDETAGRWLREHSHRFVLAEAGAGSSYSEVDWCGALTLIVGSEATGPGEIGQALATEFARIPLQNELESLNAGVAGSILLFEAARQRIAFK